MEWLSAAAFSCGWRGDRMSDLVKFTQFPAPNERGLIVMAHFSLRRSALVSREELESVEDLVALTRAAEQRGLEEIKEAIREWLSMAWPQAIIGRATATTGAGPADEQALVMPNGTPVYAEDVRALAMASMDLANQVSCLWDENGTFDPYVGDFDGMAANDAMEKILGFGPPILNPAPEAAKWPGP